MTHAYKLINSQPTMYDQVKDVNALITLDNQQLKWTQWE